jgi:hypothetical protein
MDNPDKDTLLELSSTLLTAITSWVRRQFFFIQHFRSHVLSIVTNLQDYETYSSLCAPDLTCIEPETMGNIIEGMDFHKHYFTLLGDLSLPPAPKPTTTMTNVSVGIVGFATNHAYS